MARATSTGREVACAAAGAAVGAAVGVAVVKWVERRRAAVPYASRRRQGWLLGGWKWKKERWGGGEADGNEVVGLEKDVVLSTRKRYMCSAQSISYENTSPVLMARGRGSRMYDESGIEYLDTRNNVCHVGHANPVVARAVSEQVVTLNTNTRYLHPNATALAKRLVETMPEGSELRETGVVIFVNSGSEANDLALRMCRAYTKNTGTVVLEGAYHGHTAACIEISPYKFRHASFQNKGQAAHVEVAVAPDSYRGRKSAKALAADVQRAASDLVKKGHGVSCFFVESCMSVAGVLVPPPTYFANAFAAIRQHGGLCVCDEVQTGLGRAVENEHTWYAFEHHGVLPDIVTLGKPLGNGVPVACVVAVKRVADAFARGPEYFNTFGGNPVSCAAGLAVLDQVQILRPNALQVAAHLRRRLSKVAASYTTAASNAATTSSSSSDGTFFNKDDPSIKTTTTTVDRGDDDDDAPFKQYVAAQVRRRRSSFGESAGRSSSSAVSDDSRLDTVPAYPEDDPLTTPPKPPNRKIPRQVVTIGDIRGVGLYLGVELVTSFVSREPATAAASLICSALVQKHRILTTLDGPHDNVLVIKPPLCFSVADADLFVDALQAEMRHLDTLPPEYLAGVTPTPT